MSDPKPIMDGHGLELPPHLVVIAVKWLMRQHGLTAIETAEIMANIPRGNARQRQRQEAIDVADFVESLSRG